MNESMPSSAQPPHAAQKPRIWLRVSRVRPAVSVSVTGGGDTRSGRRTETTHGMSIVIRRIALTVTAAAVAASVLHAQSESKVPAEALLDRGVLRALDEELSGVAAKDHVSRLAQFHRVPASPGFHDAIDYVVGRA